MSSAYWRINPVAIIGAAIALVSVFLPWWGIYEILGTSILSLGRWALYNPPTPTILRRLGRPETVTATNISQVFSVSSLIVLILALVAASLALAGGLTLLRKYLVAGLVVSAATPVVYAIAIAYTTTKYCLTPACATGPIGATTLFGTTFTWGFETGFYLFIVAIAITALALALNNPLTRTARTEITTIAS
jgi:hypothetical protein